MPLQDRVPTGCIEPIGEVHPASGGLGRKQPLQGLAGQAPQPEPPDPGHGRDPVVQQQIGAHKGRFGTGLELHLAQQAIGQSRWAPPQGIQTHRQQHLPLAGRRIEQHRHGLEAAIQQAPVVAPWGPVQLGPGLAIRRVQPGQTPIAGAVAETHLGQGPIERFHIHGHRPRRWACQHQGRVAGAQGRRALQASAAVQLPGAWLVGSTAAVKRQGPRFQVQLQAVVGLLLIRGPAQLQGLLQPQVGQGPRPPLLLQPIEGSRDEPRRREDHLAAQAVIAKITPFAGESGLVDRQLTRQFQPLQSSALGGLLEDLGLGLVRDAQVIQPEAGRRPLFSLPAPPVALAFKGMAGHADPAMAKRPVEGRPIHGNTLAPQAAEAGGQGLPIG